MTAQAGIDARGAGEGRGDMLDLSALWAAIKRRKFWIIAPTLAALGLSFVAVNIVTPRYTGEAKLLLESRGGFYTLPGQAAADSGQFDSEAVLSQVQIIMSRDLAREAIWQNEGYRLSQALYEVRQDTASAALQQIRAVLRQPPAPMSAAEWAEQHRSLGSLDAGASV